jgi:type VII secretion integral membrane protein EccD
LPVTVPVADLLWDLAEMLGESNGSVPATWALVRVGGQALNPELALSEQDVTSGTMLFLRDRTAIEPPPIIDDYAAGVAIVVDAQGGRWTRASAPALLAAGAAVCLAASGVVLLLAGDGETRTLFGLAGAGVAVFAGLVVSRRAGRQFSGGLIVLAAIPLWGAAGFGLAGLANAGLTASLAAGLGLAGAGAAIAVLVAGDAALVASAGVIVTTLLPAAVLGACSLFGAGLLAAAALLSPLALGSLAISERIAVRLAAIDRPDQSSIMVRAKRGRHLLAAMLIAIALVLTIANAILAASGGWFALALVAASAVAVAARARHLRFAAEVAPLLGAGLAGLLLLQLPLVAALAIGSRGIGGAAALLTADALLLVAAVAMVRAWELSPSLRRQLGRLEAIATAVTVPLAAGVLGAYAAVERIMRGLS